MALRDEIAEKLLQVKAIKLSPQNPFTWASGMRSPIYCDNRILLSYPDARKQVVDALVEASTSFSGFNAIAGVATAGIAHGAMLAQQMEMPFSYVRSKPKAHGRQNRIEGLVREGEKILVIEDLISTGGSALEAVNALREKGCTVVGVLAIFQYKFPSTQERFDAADCPFTTLSDYPTLLRVAERKGLFEPEELGLLQSWHYDAKGWSERFEKGQSR